MVELFCVKRLKRTLIILTLSSILCHCGSDAVNYRCRYPCACDKRPKDPVCAANQRTFPNQCYLDLYNENVGRKGVYVPIAYVGPCYKQDETNYPSEYSNTGEEEEVNDQYGYPPSPSIHNDTTNVPSYPVVYQSPNLPYASPPRRPVPVYSPYFQPSYGPPIKGPPPPPPYPSHYQPRPNYPPPPIYSGGYQQYPQYQENYPSPSYNNNNSMANETEIYPVYPHPSSENYTTNNNETQYYPPPAEYPVNETVVYPDYPVDNTTVYPDYPVDNTTVYPVETYPPPNNETTTISYENVYNNVYNSSDVYEMVDDYYTTTEVPTTTQTVNETTPGIPNVPRRLPPSMFVQFTPPPPSSNPSSPTQRRPPPVYVPVSY